MACGSCLLRHTGRDHCREGHEQRVARELSRTQGTRRTGLVELSVVNFDRGIPGVGHS